MLSYGISYSNVSFELGGVLTFPGSYISLHILLGKMHAGADCTLTNSYQ